MRKFGIETILHCLDGKFQIFLDKFPIPHAVPVKILYPKKNPQNYTEMEYLDNSSTYYLYQIKIFKV